MSSKEKLPAAIEEEAQQILADIRRHIITSLGNDPDPARLDTCYGGLARTIRDRMVERWLASQRRYYKQHVKRVYYLSMEFLPGRFLLNYIVNMGLREEVEKALEELNFSMEQLESQEWDAGLGNGGLGRLASCFLDSMATLKIPGYGYGIRYDYGIFHQTIENGWQVEQSDNWIRHGNPWEFMRGGYLYDVNFYGRTETHKDLDGRIRHRWLDTEVVKAMPYDTLVPGYCNDNISNMRLWTALSSENFNLTLFNQGDYAGAMEAKVRSEHISKVLYPSDDKREGRVLRLKQQYFLVAATLQDILRRFKKRNKDFNLLPQRAAVQLNDTHPTIAIAELMRLLLDHEDLEWEEAWNICVKVFSYTNHTVLPEALETWHVELLSQLLPRHMEIIFEINRRFLDEVAKTFPNQPDKLSSLSIISEGDTKRVRMAHLAIVGSHAVNGVAALHTRILREHLFYDFDQMYPGRLHNITNGVTPRRWLLQINPRLASLITSHIGDGWITKLDELAKLKDLAEDTDFRAAWYEVKQKNKTKLVTYVARKLKIAIDPQSMFDIQVKRIHEYKRQLLNILHAITLYQRMLDVPAIEAVPRTIVIAGKAAPSYFLAKLTIKLANSVADVVNHDPVVNDRLKVVFLPNYCISQAEKIIPAADLSEQISTAGMEASGTGNMKFAMNGALTIGTLDGANVEMQEEIGAENMFIFGLTADEVAEKKRNGYDPYSCVRADPELKKALTLIDSGHFSPQQKDLFKPILNGLLEHGDRYLVLADYRSYVDAQDRVDELYRDRDEWTRRSILNAASMGKFSSDRAIMEYVDNIWGTRPLAAD
jgi:starch phosphorylase